MCVCVSTSLIVSENHWLTHSCRCSRHRSWCNNWHLTLNRDEPGRHCSKRYEKHRICAWCGRDRTKTVSSMYRWGLWDRCNGCDCSAGGCLIRGYLIGIVLFGWWWRWWIVGVRCTATRASWCFSSLAGYRISIDRRMWRRRWIG